MLKNIIICLTPNLGITAWYYITDIYCIISRDENLKRFSQDRRAALVCLGVPFRQRSIEATWLKMSKWADFVDKCLDNIQCHQGISYSEEMNPNRARIFKTEKQPSLISLNSHPLLKIPIQQNTVIFLDLCSLSLNRICWTKIKMSKSSPSICNHLNRASRPLTKWRFISFALANLRKPQN